jgi:AcrR family transcriptional regulator
MVTGDTSRAIGTQSVRPGKPVPRNNHGLELRILDAARECVEKHGFSTVTVEDVCIAADISRATLYRVFPGGRDVLFEALRVRGLEEFFTVLRANVEGAQSLDQLLTRCVVVATTELQHDEHLAAMLATSPGETLGNLTVDGVARIVRVATDFFVPLVSEFVSEDDARIIVELMVRLVISFFLAPNPDFDCTNEQQVNGFIRSYLPHVHQSSVVSESSTVAVADTPLNTSHQ